MIQGYTRFDGVGLASLIRSGEVSASEVMETAIELAARFDKRLNFIALDCAEMGRQGARAPLPNSPLAGLPYLLKDAYTSWGGTVTSNGSKLFKNYISPSDSETVQRAKAAGLLLFAKSTTPEWGWALATETVLHGDTLNPWDLSRTPGGSSGGSAAAVAAGVVPLASASDGGGSIRIPAAYCGLVGLKPSRGRVSPGPDSIDGSAVMVQEGCVSRTVRDQATYLDIMHGRLPGERDVLPPLQSTFAECLTMPLRRLSIGFTTRSLSHMATYAGAVAAVEKTIKLCEQLGHRVEEMSFAGFDYLKTYSHVRAIYSIDHLNVLQMGEALKGAKAAGDDFMRFTFDSARSAAALSAQQYAYHMEGIRLGARQVETACSRFDLVVTPMSIIQPPKIGHNHMQHTEFEEYHATLRDTGMVFSVPFNVSGQPACSIPVAIDAEGLPVGVQIVGKWADEGTVLGLAAEIERAAPWIERHPAVWAGKLTDKGSSQ